MPQRKTWYPKLSQPMSLTPTPSPLLSAFPNLCPSTIEAAKCKPIKNKFGSSKAIDLSLPPEWGLAPSRYYIPFIPIIGIP